MKIWSFSRKAKYARLRTCCGRRVRFRSSSGWNATCAFPCEVLALSLRAVGTECRPYQSFGPMAGIDTSQPMSKIMPRRMLPLERCYYTTKPLYVEWKILRKSLSSLAQTTFYNGFVGSPTVKRADKMSVSAKTTKKNAPQWKVGARRRV